MELDEKGILQKYNVQLLGTKIDSIRRAEDREDFKNMMLAIGEPCIDSVIVHDVQSSVDFANEYGYPVIVRPAYTLGGTGGGIAEDEKQLREICADGLRSSRVHENLIERSVAGWKEIEYEVIRDGVATASPSATWRISIRSAYTRAIPSSSRRARLCAIRNTKCCAARR